MTSQNNVTHYAILIGIDDYPDKPLKSAVQDVEDIKTFLESRLRDSVKIQLITASQTDRTSSNPAKDPMLWPSYETIISVFKTVNSLARAGDFVYVHYSGHGTQKPPWGEFSNKSTGDLALVLLNTEKDNQVSYLWGLELASLLKMMVDNGLVITLILDCCFSASVYRRDDPTIRFLPYDAKIDSRYSLDTEIILENGDPTYRDASMRPNWLVNPDRFAILTACGPHEKAVEPKFDGQNHGALSYFLLSILERVGLTKRHHDIHNYLRAKFQSSCLPQNPVLYGNRDQGFFGQVNSDTSAAVVPIILKQHGALELQAGDAHGVIEGDQFQLYPLGSAEDDSSLQERSLIAQVVSTRALTSDLERLNTSSSHIRTGWMARALTQLSRRRFPIRIAFDLPSRDDLLAALKKHSLNASVETDLHPFAFDVVLNNDGEYGILDASGREIINLPKMSQYQTTVSEVSDILEHLVQFQLVRDLGNELPASSFQQFFEVRIVSNGKFFGPNCLIEMQHSSQAELVVENRGSINLYVSVYDLGPCWQVENVHRGTYAVVTPQSGRSGSKGTMSKKLRMMVPNQVKEKGYSSCEDILKIFITSQPTSFDLLELPKLREATKARKVDMASRESGAASENWACMNFLIQVSL